MKVELTRKHVEALLNLLDDDSIRFRHQELTQSEDVLMAALQLDRLQEKYKLGDYKND